MMFLGARISQGTRIPHPPLQKDTAEVKDAKI
jgi:hypothetical protein